MMISPPRLVAALRRAAAPLALGLLLASTGCYYNGHRNMGATEKYACSDQNVVTKTTGTFFISIFDSLIGPGTMAWDQMAYDPQYSPEHKYFSFANSRTVAHSDMGKGYQWVTMVPTLVFDVVYLVITGPVDMVWILGSDKDKSDPKGVHPEYVANSSHPTTAMHAE